MEFEVTPPPKMDTLAMFSEAINAFLLLGIFYELADAKGRMLSWFRRFIFQLFPEPSRETERDSKIIIKITPADGAVNINCCFYSIHTPINQNIKIYKNDFILSVIVSFDES